MKYFFCFLGVFFFFVTAANASCTKLNLSSEFLAPFNTETQKWHVDEPHYYDDPNLGFSIKLQTSDTTVDLYVFDFGINNFSDDMTNQLLRQSVSEMLQAMNYYETLPTSAPRLLNKSLFQGSEKYLVHNAAFVVQERKPKNILSIVSIGFDGDCFQKLRFTKELISKDIDIKNYFENPSQEVETLTSILGFVGLVKILNEELFKIGYYK